MPPTPIESVNRPLRGLRLRKLPLGGLLQPSLNAMPADAEVESFSKNLGAEFDKANKTMWADTAKTAEAEEADAQAKVEPASQKTVAELQKVLPSTLSKPIHAAEGLLSERAPPRKLLQRRLNAKPRPLGFRMLKPIKCWHATPTRNRNDQVA